MPSRDWLTEIYPELMNSVYCGPDGTPLGVDSTERLRILRENLNDIPTQAAHKALMFYCTPISGWPFDPPPLPGTRKINPNKVLEGIKFILCAPLYN